MPSKLKSILSVKVPLLIVAALLALCVVSWKPWVANVKASDRTISVTGDAKIIATPDQYVFYPQYQFKQSDAKEALKEAAIKNNEVTSALKKLGVKESKIKADTSGFSEPRIYGLDKGSETEAIYYDSLTITVSNKELAQKVQDYLLTTSPTGSVSPQASFSDDLRKKLESRGRDQATKDAHSKAEQSARNLGFTVGKVKSFSDGTLGGGIRPMEDGGHYSTLMATDKAETSTLPILTGEDSVTYQVSVTFYLR